MTVMSNGWDEKNEWNECSDRWMDRSEWMKKDSNAKERELEQENEE